jgi:hypothetical protein
MIKRNSILLLAALLFTTIAYSQNAESVKTRFSVKEINGIWWLTNSENKPFFSSGVCCVNPGLTFDEYTPANPGYAAWQHFTDPVSWAQNTMDSLTAWGYTTIGGWSSMEHFFKVPGFKMYSAPVLAMGATAGAPWFDMWDSTVIKRMDEVAREQITRVVNNPYVIGYYSDNEFGWWHAAMWNMTLQQGPESTSRKKTIELVINYYNGKWENLIKDFDPEGAHSFDELKIRGRLYLRPGGNGMQVIRKFSAMLAERYYSLTNEIIHKYDPRALILGDRYQSFYYNEIAEIAGKYVDVISTNLNAHWNDGTLCRFFLDNLYKLAKKPVMIGEYYMAAHENRSGNKNSVATFPTVQTQKERANNFLVTSKIIAQTPFIVGADWFQFYDEPTHGRTDGENFNMGLVDINGKPYEELTKAAGGFDWQGIKKQPVYNLPDASTGIPPAPADNIIIPENKVLLSNWDRIHGFVKPETDLPSADMYVCWSKDTLYIAVYGIDIVEKEYYRDNIIPEEDRMELVLKIGGNKDNLKIRLGSGRKPEWDEKSIDVFNSSGIFLTVNNITVVKIPAKLFGKKMFKAGDSIKLSANLTTFARSSFSKWDINYKLAGRYSN